ncbi:MULTISPECIES: hypothetical protein [unclassified Haloferax]|uniref:hypothetical protein n=1 Tax=unclassified Haloferax TaxID=2625095 RepID=UPI000B31C3F2|nr:MULTISPECIES: hypothetical protein [unclassified Haloferax]
MVGGLADAPSAPNEGSGGSSADAGSAAGTRPGTGGRAAVGGSQPPVRWSAAGGNYS